MQYDDFIKLSSQEKREVLLSLRNKLLQNQDPGQDEKSIRDELYPKLTADVAGRYDAFPLSDIQEAYLVGRQTGIETDRVGCHVYLEFETAELDIPRLNSAWNRLMACHDVLHMKILADGRQQVLEAFAPYHCQVHDLSRKCSNDQSAFVETIRKRMSHKVYEPGQWPLFEVCITRLNPNRHVIHLSIDEWIVDFSSIKLLVTQWNRLYDDPQTQLPEPAITFRDYLLAVKQFETSFRYQRDVNYWMQKLSPLPPGPALPYAGNPRKSAYDPCVYRQRYRGRLEKKQWARLQEKADAFNVSPTILLLTLFGELLRAHCDPKSDFSIILTHFNRLPLHPHINAVLGPFISTNLFTIDQMPEATMAEKATHHQQQLWNAMDHSNVSGVKVLRILRRHRKIKPSLTIPIVFTSTLGTPHRDESEWWTRLSVVTQTPQVYLDHQVLEQNGCLHYAWDVADGYFLPGFTQQLFFQFGQILKRFSIEDHIWQCRSITFIKRPEENQLQAEPSIGGNKPVAASDFRLQVDAARRDAEFPLTEQQQAYLFGRTSQGPSGNMSCQVYKEFDIQNLDIERLACAFNTLIDTHEMLRAVILSKGAQKIIKHAEPYRIRIQDLSGKDPVTASKSLEETRRLMEDHIFALGQWPSFDLRVSLIDGTQSRMHFSIDMLIADGNSIALLIRQLFDLYANPEKRLAPPEMSFRDYIMGLNRFNRTRASENITAYWKSRFATMAPGPRLPVHTEPTPKKRSARRSLHGVLPDWPRFKAQARQLRVAPGMILLTAYIEVLSHYSRSSPFSIVVVNWNRPDIHKDIHRVVGDFTALSWVTHSDPMPFSHKVRKHHQTVQEDLSHCIVSGLSVMRKVAMPAILKGELIFPVVFTNLMEHAEPDLPGTIETGYQSSKTPQVHLDNISIEAGKALHYHWDGIKGMWPEGMLEAMFAGYQRLLEALASDPAAWEREDFKEIITVAAPQNRGALPPLKKEANVKQWNDTAKDYPSGKCLHQFIEDRVRMCPDHIALRFEDEQLTYQQLNQRANQCAHLLKDLGTGPDKVVGLMMNRSLELVVCMLGILKAGGAYLPLDAAYPQARLQFMLEDADVSVLLLQEQFKSLLPEFKGKKIYPDSRPDVFDGQSTDDPQCTAADHHLAYVLYTSGSTGKPKGCMLPHKAINNRLFWMQDAYCLTGHDRVLQKTPYTFDVSVWEFFWPLLTGAQLVLARPEGHKDSRYLCDVIRDRAITTCHFVPSMLNFFVNEPDVVRCSSLRQVFASGEALPYRLMTRFLEKLPHTKLHNLYGPTEAAVDVTYWECSPNADKRVPIGRPIANIQIHILDKNLNPLNIGGVGELHIAGVGLARGYLNRPELTAKSFINNPFDPDPEAKLYKTGDLARWLPDGNIEYLGRIDFQVKIRGLRVELGEIEEALLSHPSVAEALVLVQNPESADPKLVAYVVPFGNKLSASTELRQYLGRRLPAHMVPNFVIPVPEFPVTAHGKTDRKRLPWPIKGRISDLWKQFAEERQAATDPKPANLTGALPDSQKPGLPERRAITRQLTHIAKQALSMEEIESDEDIFDLGATSLTLVNLSQKIQDVYGTTISVADLVDDFMAHPTIDWLSQKVYHTLKAADQEHGPVASEKIAAVPEKIEGHDTAAEPAKDEPPPGIAPLNGPYPVVKEILHRDTVIELAQTSFKAEHYALRTCRRGFSDQTIPFQSFCAFMSLLKEQKIEGIDRPKYLYPSSGGKNCIQIYLYLKSGAVEGIEAGTYYYHQIEHRLYLLTPDTRLNHSIHFEYNRKAFDEAGFCIFFIAQTKAIEPIYLDVCSILYYLDSGYISQLLLSRQAAFGIGLQPVSGVDFKRIRSHFKLDAGHQFIHCLLGGYLEHAKAEPGGDDAGADGQGLENFVRKTGRRLSDHIRGEKQALTSTHIKKIFKEGRYAHMTGDQMRAFEAKKLHLRRFSPNTAFIPLVGAAFQKEAYTLRSSRRQFSEKPVPFAAFSRFMGLMKMAVVKGRPKYLYPSIGGTYGVQVYLFIKENRVEGFPEGIYYYHPVRHAMVLVSVNSRIRKSIKHTHMPFNRKNFIQSGFSIYLIAQLDAYESVWADQALHLALLEAGHVGQVLMDHQAQFEIGLVPIGGLKFNKIEPEFKLNPKQTLLHSFMGGIWEQKHKVILPTHLDIEPPSAKAVNNYLSAPAVQPPAEPDVAIVGLSGRYPGAENPEQFWDLLISGRHSITEVPRQRWDFSEYYGTDPAGFGTYTKWGGFLSHVDQFDNLLFNIAPLEARTMDPQERLFMEITWECLENAGYTRETLNALCEKVAVFIGAMWTDYSNVGADTWHIDRSARGCSLHASIANRISHYFNFSGPSVAVNTSCSSALTALHFACESIRKGESKAAVVGGVNLLLHPYHFNILCSNQLLSPSDKCCAFGAEGSGWVVGEGVGAVLLKPLADAEKDGDHIHGVIKATAIKHTGKSTRFGAAYSKGQLKSLQAVLANSHVSSQSIGFVESAATGSSLADASEINALTKAFAGVDAEQFPCYMGSVKPNIGHLESASGMAQLTKVLLQLKHRRLAPSIHCHPPSPLIQLDGTRFQIVKAARPWNRLKRSPEKEEKYPLRALVNAFGATGSSAHVIVQEYGNRETAPKAVSQAELMVLSAASPEQLQGYAARLAAYLDGDHQAQPRLAGIAATLKHGRQAMAHRLAIIADNIDDLKSKLDSFSKAHAPETGVFMTGEVLSGEAKETVSEKDYPLETIAQKWIQGADVRWEKRFGYGLKKVPLPTYPFAKARHWLPPADTTAAQASPASKGKPASGPLPEQVRWTSLNKPVDTHSRNNAALRTRTIDYVLQTFAAVSEIPISKLNAKAPMENYGLTSLMIKMLNSKIEKDFGEISPVVFYECQTLADVAEYFAADHGDRARQLFGLEAPAEELNPASLSADTTEAIQSSDAMTAAASIDGAQDIAIIGISGKYPEASDVFAFWENLKNGRDCITQIPKHRWDFKAYYDTDRKAKGKVASKWGGFISDADCFDADFFNIPHHQAVYLDPQERLLLQAAWETIEDSGYRPDGLGRFSSGLPEATGVYIGCMYHHYPWLAQDRDQGVLMANHSIWAIANRISYFFDFDGPSIACDTSCSSALTVLHLACSGIKNGDCRTALVGAVNLTLHPSKYFALSQNRMLASHPKSMGLGDGGDGFVPAEGVGAVLLKPLSAAIGDRDNIQGIIKASFVNHSGKTNGFMVPNPLKQEELIVKTLMRAGIHPRTIGYVETAANGSELGDAIEISSLTKAFKRFTQAKGYCAIGSVKSNIGHSEAVSGLSQLTKVVMQLKNKALVPSINCDPMNKHIDLSDSPFYVQRQLSHWDRPQMEIDGVIQPGPRRAAISSIGGGGSCAHIVLEEYQDGIQSDSQRADGPQIVILSAKNETSLREYARKLSAFLQLNRKSPDLTLLNIAYTLQMGRVPMEERLAMTVANIDQLIAKLDDFRQDRPSGGLYRGKVCEEMLKTIEFFNGREAAEFLKVTIEDRKLEKVAYLWVNGIDPDWHLFYKNGLPRRISLPTYAFQKKRYWIAEGGEVFDFAGKADIIPEPVDKPENKPAQPKSRRLQTGTVLEPKTTARQLEAQLTEILKKLMDVKKISATTNFFDLGVQSMTLVQFQGKIKTVLRIDLPMITFFNASTIRKVSKLIAAEGTRFRVADEYGGKEEDPKSVQEDRSEERQPAKPDPDAHPVNTSLRNRRKRLKADQKKQHKCVA